MMIRQINSIGKVKIEFSKPMIDEEHGFNLTNLNNETLGVSVISASTLNLIEMSWAPESFLNQILMLQLKFDNPAEISIDRNNNVRD